MAVKTRRIKTSFAKGELSPLLEGRPDLAAFFEGARQLENVMLLRQGGVTRRAGTRFIKEVKTSALDTILLPFEFSVDDAFILEVGNTYVRFYKNKAQLTTSAAGPAVELATTYLTADLRVIHFTQSADVLFLFHVGYAQRKLSRVSDTNWALTTITYSPPPSFSADTDLAATLGVGANTGAAIKMRAGSAVFLAGDIGRQVIAGAGRAVITAVDTTSQVTVDILDNFGATITAGPNTITAVGTAAAITGHGAAVGNFIVVTNGAQAGQVRRVTVVVDVDNVTLDAAFPADPVAATWNKVLAVASGAWFLRLAPQTTLDPTIREPVGAQVTLVAGLAAFRAADVGKFIFVYGGLILITIFDSTTQVRGQLQSVLAEAVDANPAAAPAGAWTLEVASWSTARGFPRTGEFFQGRLYQAATLAQPTTFWGSRADDFDNMAVGIAADDAVEYTLASRKVNRIEWLADNLALFLGTTGSEHRATGGVSDAPIGGDVIPLVERLDTIGSAQVQPVVLARRTLFLDRNRQRLYSIGFDLEEDGFLARDLTAMAEHITGTGLKLGHLAFARRPDPRLYMINSDEELVTLTYFPQEKVVGFTRYVTDGAFESVAVIPDANRGADQVWVVVRRVIDGATVRYVELIEENHASLSARPWTSMQTDCGIVSVAVSATATVAGLDHLEGETVQVIKNGGYLGDKVVVSGAITLDEALTIGDVVEVGLGYVSTIETMRPAVENQVIEGLPRSWDSLWARLKDTRGGKINGHEIQYVANDLDETGLFTGDKKVPGIDWGTDGSVTITQDQPYPMTVLALFGTLSLGDTD